MLDICRHRVEEGGITSRCYFHEGYLDSLPTEDLYDGATCFPLQWVQIPPVWSLQPVAIGAVEKAANPLKPLI